MTTATVPTWKTRLEQYGRLGIYVYFAIFFLTLTTIAAMLEFGLADRIPWMADHVGDAGTWLAAYALTKLLQVPRIAATLAITPIVARRLGRA